MFWKEQPRHPAVGEFRTIWSGKDFIVYDSDNVEVFRIRASDSRVGARLADGIVETDVLADLAVTTDKIYPAAVVSSSLMDHSIGYVKLHDDVLQTASIVIPADEIKTLFATPVELVAAPAGGEFIEFVSAVLHFETGTEVLDGTRTLDIGYSSGTISALEAAIPATFHEAAADMVFVAQPASAIEETAAGVLAENLAITASDVIGGNTTNDSVLTVNVTYRVLTLG